MSLTIHDRDPGDEDPRVQHEFEFFSALVDSVKQHGRLILGHYRNCLFYESNSIPTRKGVESTPVKEARLDGQR